MIRMSSIRRMSVRKTEIFLNGKKFTKIEIIRYPTCSEKNNNNKEEEEEDDDMLYYYCSTTKKEKAIATNKCIEIISRHNHTTQQELFEGNKKSIRVYCPFHENLQTSHTKSGQLFAHQHRYICYSNKCTLPKNDNGKRLVSTLKFFLEYQKI